MTDFLSHLIEQSNGYDTGVRPAIPPLFAPAPQLAHDAASLEHPLSALSNTILPNLADISAASAPLLVYPPTSELVPEKVRHATLPASPLHGLLYSTEPIQPHSNETALESIAEELEASEGAPPALLSPLHPMKSTEQRPSLPIEGHSATPELTTPTDTLSPRPVTPSSASTAIGTPSFLLPQNNTSGQSFSSSSPEPTRKPVVDSTNHSHAQPGPILPLSPVAQLPHSPLHDEIPEKQNTHPTTRRDHHEASPLSSKQAILSSPEVQPEPLPASTIDRPLPATRREEIHGWPLASPETPRLSSHPILPLIAPALAASHTTESVDGAATLSAGHLRQHPSNSTNASFTDMTRSDARASRSSHPSLRSNEQAAQPQTLPLSVHTLSTDSPPVPLPLDEQQPPTTLLAHPPILPLPSFGEVTDAPDSAEQQPARSEPPLMISVRIGRVEVRATSSTANKPLQKPVPKPVLTLREYLEQRRRDLQ